MRSAAVAVAATIALCAASAGLARAGELDHMVVDRVDVQPSRLPNLVRVRMLVSAIYLRGARIELSKPKDFVLKLGGFKPDYLTGTFAKADAEVDVYLMVPTSFEFSADLETIKERLASDLLEPLAKLGSQVHVQVVGFGETTSGAGRPGSIDGAKKELGKLYADEYPAFDPVDVVTPLDKVISAAKRRLRKPRKPGYATRAMVILVSDGSGGDDKRTITELGQRAGKYDIRIHSLAYSPTEARRPLLALGELSKQSLGTFRWVRTMEGWTPALEQLVDEIQNQYVLTFFATPDDVAGKRIKVSASAGEGEVESESTKLPAPECGGETCDGNQYCALDVCVPRQLVDGRSVLAWVLLVGGIAIGGIILLIGIAALISKVRSRGPALPGAVAVGGAQVGAAPGAPGAAPVQAAPAGPPPPPGGPVFIILSGSRQGQQVPLRHGFTVGKAPGSDLDLSEDSFASTNHAQVTFDGATWTVIDQGSTNGTFSNGVRINQARLDKGMTIRFGSTDVRFWTN